MKKNVGLITLITCLILAVTSCKEIPPVIDFSEPVLLATDTTYVTTNVPQNVLKNVLIEDISGVKCNNCPKAADIAHDIQDANPGRVVVITLHSKKMAAFTAPYEDSKDTFNTQAATDIIDNLYIGNILGLPIGGIDRKVFSGETQSLIPYTAWETRANEQLLTQPRVDLELEVIRKDGRTVIANVKTTFLEKDDSPVFLSVFLLESHIKSKQKLPDNTYDKNFEHNSILRESITNASGLKLADNVELGRVFEKGFEIEIPEKYVMDECKIAVLVNKVEQDNFEVLQCTEESL